MVNKLKKNKIFMLLTMSIILFIYSYLIFWFNKEIFEYVFMLLGFPMFIIFPLYIFIIISSLLCIKVNCKKIFNWLPLFTIIILTLLFNFLNPTKLREQMEYKKYYNKRNKMVQEVIKKNISYTNNIVELPEEYKQISNNGKMYIYLNNKQDTLIGFSVYMSFPDEGSEIIYSSGGKRLIEENFNSVHSIEQRDNNWFYVKFD